MNPAEEIKVSILLTIDGQEFRAHESLKDPKVLEMFLYKKHLAFFDEWKESGKRRDLEFFNLGKNQKGTYYHCKIFHIGNIDLPPYDHESSPLVNDDAAQLKILKIIYNYCTYK